MTNQEQIRRTALVVDDDPAFQELLARILDDAGFATTAFDRGQPALSAIGQHYFDLLLIDQGLPDLNGIQICEAARERYGNTTAVLLVTADHRAERHITALTFGADDVISKPFHVDVLLARIEAKLRRREQATM
jgi:DNA-binding response OmpR family regulator